MKSRKTYGQLLMKPFVMDDFMSTVRDILDNRGKSDKKRKKRRPFVNFPLRFLTKQYLPNFF